MVRAGIMVNPLLPPADGSSNPLMPPSLGGSLGGSSVETALAGIAALGQNARQGLADLRPPPEPAGPSYGFNSATNQFFAKGRTFEADDYQAAVESADQQGTAAPLPQGFQPLSEQQFSGYVSSIRNPSTSTLASRNFGRGIDQLQMLGGRGLQLLGAEETGQRIVEQQVEDLRKTTPYERQFTDIESGGDAVDWFVANLAQQGPMLLEAIGAGAAGFFAGGAVGGPLGAAGGALAGLAGRTAFKQAVLAAARKKAAGEALDQAESKILKSAAGLAGATAAATANSIQMGASDIYGELRDQGADAEDVGARLTALFGSIPYAAMDLLPEYALASRVFGTAVRSGAQVARRGDMLRRAGKGLVTGAALEGSTEAGQEALLLGLSDQDFSDPKNIQRLVNSFAAGAAIGGPIGAVANLKRGKPTDVLGSGSQTEPQAGQMELPLEGGASGTFVGPQQPFARLRPGETQQELFGTQDLGRGPGGQQLELPFGREPTPVGTQFDLPFGQPPARDEQQLEFQFAPGAPPVVADQFSLPFEQGVPQAPPRLPPIGTQGEMFSGADLGAMPLTPQRAVDLYMQGVGRGNSPADLQIQQYFADDRYAPEIEREFRRRQTGQPVADSREIQDVLPLETGLPPRFFADQRTQRAQPPAAGTIGGANPVLAALQRRMQTNPQFDAAEQERAAQVAAQEQQAPGMAALRRGLTLQQIQPELLAAETALPEVQTSTSPTDAAEAWRRLAGRGRPKAFEKFLPAIQNQWIDALNMAVAGELTQDDLKQIRTELVQAETIARITKSEPRVVVTGAITPLEPDPKPPTPPKGNKLRADQKPKPTAVARTQPAGRGGQGLKRGAGGTTGQATGAPVAAATQPAAKSAESVPVQQPKAEAVRKAVGPSTTAVERADMSDSERLAAATEVAETYTKVDEAYEDAIYDIVSVGYFDKITSGEVNARKALTDKARSFIEDTKFTAKQREVISKVFTAQIKDAKTEGLSAVSGNNVAPWLQFMIDAGRLEDTRPLRGNVKNINKIADPVVRDQVAAVLEAKKAASQVTSPTQESKAVDPSSPLASLVRFMAEYLKRGRLAAVWDNEFTFEGNTYSYGPRGFAEDMFAEINPADTAAQFMGVPIREYFNKDGSLRLVEGSRIMSGGNEFVTLKIGTAEDAKRGPTTATVDTTLVKGKRGERVAPTETVDNRTLKPSDTGKFSLSSFNNPEASMSEGAIKLAVGKFLSKLVIKPKVTVVRNQADLMRRYPALYRKAVAERPQGDFDAAQAAGYSFADGNVIIFSDRIANEQHLNFVLGHETIGHFGLRGIIPQSKFNAVMDQVYQSSPYIQADVDAFVAQGMSKEEAVEEYLSDFAGILDTSVVARIWNAIKGALNKLGIKFGDEMVRHLLKQSRSYVRQGKSYIHQTDQVFTDMYLVENGYGPQGTGRFSSVGSVHDTMRTAENRRFADQQRPTDMTSAWKEFVSYVGPTARQFDRFASEFLSLQVFRSRKNPGAQRLYEILQATNGIATRVRVKSNERNKAIFDASQEVANRTSELLYAAQRLADSRIDNLRKLGGPPLYSVVNGVLEPNFGEISRLKKMGRIEFEQALNGFDYPVVDETGATRMERFAGIKGLTKDSTEWKGYETLRESMDDVELDLLRARYSATLTDRKVSFKQFDELVDGELTPDERQFVDSLLNTYRDLYAESTKQDGDGNTIFDRSAMQRADDFLVAVNKSILNLEEGYTEIAAFFKGTMADDTVAKLRALSKRIKLGEDKFVIQTRMKQLMIDSLSTDQADLFTRRSIATGYTPLLREGAYQLRLQAINPRTGQPVKLDEASRDKLVYMQMESERDVVRLAGEINDLLSENGKPKRYTLKAYNADTQKFENSEVILVAKAERALDAVTGPPQLNLNEFQYGLRQLNISLTPAEVQNVVVAMTRQNSAARNRLSRGYVPGADRDAIKAISKHIDGRASTIAKTEMRPYLNELMNLSMRSTKLLWEGDPKLLKKLKEQAEDQSISADQRLLRQREYVRYKYMYDTTNPKGGAERGNEFYNEAARTVQFLNENRDVSTSNFEAGAVASRLRSFTSAVQLGGSLATAILNFIGVYTNALPFLATYNERNGFGGGFGAGAAVTEYHRALGQVGGLGITNPKANTAEFYDQLSDADLKRIGLTRNEAKFIAREIREGSMIPAQSNALINTSRGRSNSPFVRRFLEVWMAPFNMSEQAARRSLGLAAYRLEYARQKQAGVAEDKAVEAARRFAVETLDVTMGEYSVLNRPAAWRSGIQSFLYMYKVYPTTAIQLLANMPRSGQIAMLGMLLLLSGMQGLPFAEDLEDIVDTIAQALGLTMGSIRAEVVKLIDSTMPGASVPFVQGLVGMFLPGDIGARTSLGNLFPGTGVLLAGADVSRELNDIAGPMPSAMIQSAKTVYNTLRLPFSDQVTLPDVMRESPVTMMRVAGDAVAYAEAGVVVDKRGYTVSEDAGAGVMAARILGFYPTDAARQYAAIRISTRITDYQRDTVTSYRTAWVRAKMAGDNDGARDIERAVQRWNEGAEGTGLRIRNFMQGSQRALREAKRPAGERALRTTPAANRADIEQVYDLMGAT